MMMMIMIMMTMKMMITMNKRRKKTKLTRLMKTRQEVEDGFKKRLNIEYLVLDRFKIIY